MGVSGREPMTGRREGSKRRADDETSNQKGGSQLERHRLETGAGVSCSEERQEQVSDNNRNVKVYRAWTRNQRG